MKRALLAFTICLPLLGGCEGVQAIGAGNAPISSVAPAEFNKIKQALTAAHLVHKTTADFLVIAADSNLCKSTCALKAKELLNQSAAILAAADAAVVTGDARSIEAKIAAATALVGQIQSLIGSN
jgi:hypothetical protein